MRLLQIWRDVSDVRTHDDRHVIGCFAGGALQVQGQRKD